MNSCQSTEALCIKSSSSRHYDHAIAKMARIKQAQPSGDTNGNHYGVKLVNIKQCVRTMLHNSCATISSFKQIKLATFKREVDEPDHTSKKSSLTFQQRPTTTTRTTSKTTTTTTSTATKLLLGPIMLGSSPALSMVVVVVTLLFSLNLTQHQNGAQAVTTISNQQSTSEPGVAQGAALNYLLFASRKQQQQQNRNFKLEELLKDTNHSHVSDRINIQLANSVWKQMQQNALEFAHRRSDLARPAVNRLLEQANVSSACKQSLNDIIDHLEKLDDWAVRMYNSFGEFPANGFFEGTHTAMGDYHQCVNLEANEYIGQAQYCTFKFQPILPKRPRYHSILAPIENLANFTTQDDMFHGLAKKAHYFYYTKLRLATCMPSKCEKTDLELLGEQIAVNTYLQFQGTDCLKKSPGFNPDGAQIFSLAVLISLASVSLLGTLVHVLNLKSLLAKPRSQSLSSLSSSNSNDNNENNDINSNNGRHGFNNNQQVVLQQQTLLPPNQGQKVPMLAAPIVQVTTTTTTTTTSNTNGHHHHNNSGSASGRRRRIDFKDTFLSRLAYACDILMHFSIIRNGRKLFDTSTSRRGGNGGASGSSSSRTSSLVVPGMKEVVASSEMSVNCNAVVGSTNDQDHDDDDGNASGSGRDGATCSSSGSQSTGHHSSDSVNGVQVNQPNDISCVHGLRFWTISWIILGHTMQYTEWAGFGRAYQIEENITSFLLHPLLNATFSVDTFFLISGLLTTYVTWTITRGQYWRFNKFAFLISRYLRLTPQVLLVLLIFIVFPLMGDGPYWRGLIQKESDYCKRNWWVSALYLQSFYRSDQICNLVTWWLSIEMFYHFVSIIVIIALLHSARKGIIAALLVGGSMTGVSCYLHYVNQYPPNMLPTLLQRYEIWDSIVLKYFWTPYPHAPSYFTGLLLGYALYNRSISQLSRKQIRYGWLAFTICYLSILFGTYHWNNNAPYSRLVSTVYYNLSQIIWSLATGWAILACALGHGGWLNSFLSSPVFVPLGRATYMTYLSHMIIVRAYPAKMNLLIEPTYIVFLYIFIANLFLSYALGICLTLVYESPILHLQKLVVSRMALKFNEEKNPKTTTNKNSNSDGQKVVRVVLYSPQQQVSADN